MLKKKSYEKTIKFAGATLRKRGASWQVEFNLRGQRKRKTLSTLEEAMGYVEGMRIELANQGMQAFNLSSEERIDAGQALDIIEGRVTLAEAAQVWADTHKEPEKEILVGQLLEEYLQAKRVQNRRPGTIYEIKNKLNQYFRIGEITYLHEITRLQILGWLNEHTSTPVGRNKTRRLVHGFLNFALRRGLIEVNPASSIENATVDEKLPDAYSVEDTSKLLSRAAKS